MTPTPWQSSPKPQRFVNLYIALCFSCFVNPKQKPTKHQFRQSRTETLGFGKQECGIAR